MNVQQPWEKNLLKATAGFEVNWILPLNMDGIPQFEFSMSRDHTEELWRAQKTSEWSPSTDSVLTVLSTSVSVLKSRATTPSSLQVRIYIIFLQSEFLLTRQEAEIRKLPLTSPESIEAAKKSKIVKEKKTKGGKDKEQPRKAWKTEMCKEIGNSRHYKLRVRPLPYSDNGESAMNPMKMNASYVVKIITKPKGQTIG